MVVRIHPPYYFVPNPIDLFRVVGISCTAEISPTNHMQSIATALKLPNGCPVDSIQGLVSKVFPSKELDTKYGKKTKQDFCLKDAADNEIFCQAWGWADLKMYEGKEVVLKQGKPDKGLAVSRRVGKDKQGQDREYISLDVSNAAQFQIVSGQPAAESSPSGAPKTQEATQVSTSEQNPVKTTGTSSTAPSSLISGQSVGCALNNAIELIKYVYGPDEVLGMMANGLLWGKVNELASGQIRLSRNLEHGNLYPEAPSDKTDVPY